MTILITGARGRIARTAIHQLVESGADVRPASRSAATAEPIAGVPVVDFDLSRPETIRKALDGVHQVLLYAAHDGIEPFVQAAGDSDIEHVVLVSSAAADYPDAESNPVGRGHLAAERVLQRSLSPSNGGHGWTFLRPGMFASNTLWWRPSIVESGTVRIAYPEAQVNVIHEADIADVAVAALTEPDRHDGRAYPLGGPESISQADQVRLVGEAIGTDLAIEELSHEQAAEFWPAPVLQMLAENRGTPVPTGPTSEEITGKPARTFAQWATDHAADFR